MLVGAVTVAAGLIIYFPFFPIFQQVKRVQIFADSVFPEDKAFEIESYDSMRGCWR